MDHYHSDSRPSYLFLATEIGFICHHFWELASAVHRAGWQVIIAGTDAGDRQHARDAGMELVPIRPFKGFNNPFGELKSFFQVCQIIRKRRPQIVHLVSLKSVLVGGVVARLLGVPGVVGAITGLGILFTEERLFYRIMRPLVMACLKYVFGHPNCVMALENEDDRRFFVDNGIISAQRAIVIPGAGLDEEAIRPTPHNSEPPVILLVSRMIKNKGVGELVDAARLMRQGGLNFRVQLVGDIDERNPMSFTSEELQAMEDGDFIRWLGKRRDVAKLLGDASIFCLPTYYREGLPRSLVEAGAAGLPIVTTDMPGCRDVVIDCVNGFKVPPHDVEAIAEALSSLVREPQLRRAMGAESRKRFEQCFSKIPVLRAFMKCHASLKMPINLVDPAAATGQALLLDEEATSVLE